MKIEDIIAARYRDLSAKLREAADVVLANQLDVATRSLRTVSDSTGVSPATMSRLARALGFATYEDMRELTRSALETRIDGIPDRALKLRSHETGRDTILDRQAAACIANITQMQTATPRQKIDDAVDLLLGAHNVVLFGAFGAAGSVEYLAYLASYFSSNWMLAGRRGASLGAALAGIERGDVFFAVTKAPYAKRAVIAVETAHKQGAATIVITDSHTCPAMKHADIGFIVPSESPQFFSSYAATMVLIESLIATYVARSSEDTLARIKDVTKRNSQLGEFWPD